MMQIFTRVYCQLLCSQLARGSRCCPCRGLQQSSAGLSTLEGTLDRYNGVTVDIRKQLPDTTSTHVFQNILKASLSHWRRDERSAIWLQVPIHYGRFIDVAAAAGFQFHNAEHDQCLLKLWLQDRADPTPRFATHQVGVCGVVMREETQELLVVQEKKSQFTFWKFPGGLSDLSEDIDNSSYDGIQSICSGSKAGTMDVLRQHVFASGTPDLRYLPPTEDAFCLHIKRCLYKLSLYQRARESDLSLPPPTDYRKSGSYGRLVPLMMTKPAKPPNV